MESREAAQADSRDGIPHDEDAARLRLAFDQMCSTFGGPQQFLSKRLADKDSQARFAKQLRSAFPPLMGKTYCVDYPLPAIREEDMAAVPSLVVHISCLGNDESCTMKHPPLAETCKKIMEEVLTDGFVTASEPLKVTMAASADRHLLPDVSEGCVAHSAW
eukprot:2935892-Alexandrium_andersonii.AAC.1